MSWMVDGWRQEFQFLMILFLQNYLTFSMSDWSVLQTLKVICNIISMSESKDGYIFCYFVSKSSKISHVGHLPLMLKSPPNNTWKCTPVTFHTWDSNQYVGLHMHFSHPFLGIYEVVQFFDLGYPFQGWYMSAISIPWYHGMETSYHIHLFPIPCHLIPGFLGIAW